MAITNWGIVTANDYSTPGQVSYYSQWVWAGNVFGGGPTPAKQESFGAVKARYR